MLQLAPLRSRHASRNSTEISCVSAAGYHAGGSVNSGRVAESKSSMWSEPCPSEFDMAFITFSCHRNAFCGQKRKHFLVNRMMRKRVPPDIFNGISFPILFSSLYSPPSHIAPDFLLIVDNLLGMIGFKSPQIPLLLRNSVLSQLRVNGVRTKLHRSSIDS